ncbi:MAG: putative bifunctional diguanylate cyclase/phosphodiesterase [Pseudomonadales bacterium]
MAMQKNWNWLEQNEARDSVSPHLLRSDAALGSLFEAVIMAAEAAWDMSGSILLLNTQRQTLHTAAGPSLPDFYSQAIDGVSIGEGVGSCGHAAYTAQVTIVEDIQTHANWAPFKALAASADLHACWSIPILNNRNTVLGTFACYFSEAKAPTQRQLDFMSAAGKTLAVAIEQRQLQQVVAQLSYFDPLTGLQNRAAFRKSLQEQIDARLPLALLFLDLDNFKEINDTLGHEAGDKLIQTISQRFSELETERVCFSRIGGDEFTVIYQSDNIESVDDFSQRIIDIVNQPVTVGNDSVQVSTSIGIACFPEHGEELSQLMKHADIAMYHAKSSGRNRSCHFSNEMKEQLLQRINLQHELRIATEQGQFEIYYQPQVDNFSDRPVCVEALIRWNHPSKGVLPANYFIESIEANGFINMIDLWVLESSCRHIGTLDARYSLAVNLSSVHLSDVEFPSKVFSILARTGFDPKRLILEVTERTLIQNTSTVQPVMNALRQRGIRFAIDDFGTGYSSLNYLKMLPISEVKIDKSFVRDITTDRYDKEICSSLCSMAKNLDLHIVAEGVEREEQKGALKAMGCMTVQGFFLSEPLPLEALKRYLSAAESAELAELKERQLLIAGK